MIGGFPFFKLEHKVSVNFRPMKIKCCLFKLLTKLWSWMFSSVLNVLMVPGYLAVVPLLEAGVFLKLTLLIICCDDFTNRHPQWLMFSYFSREIKSYKNGLSRKLIILKWRSKFTVLSVVSVEGNVGVIVVMLREKWSVPCQKKTLVD